MHCAGTSKIDQLPPDLKAWVEKELQAHAYGGSQEIAQALTDDGHPVGKSSVHRYAQRLREKTASIRASAEFTASLIALVGDHAETLDRGLILMMEEKLLRAMTEDQDLTPEELSDMARSVASLTRASVAGKKYDQTAARQRAKETAEQLDRVAKKGGLTPDTVAQIRREILGIAA